MKYANIERARQKQLVKKLKKIRHASVIKKLHELYEKSESWEEFVMQRALLGPTYTYYHGVMSKGKLTRGWKLFDDFWWKYMYESNYVQNHWCQFWLLIGLVPSGLVQLALYVRNGFAWHPAFFAIGSLASMTALAFAIMSIIVICTVHYKIQTMIHNSVELHQKYATVPLKQVDKCRNCTTYDICTLSDKIDIDVYDLLTSASAE